MCDDAKLAKLLDVALPNILGFLGVSSTAVKTKTMEILSHLNKRVKTNASIPLPLGALVKLFASSSTAPLVANFALVYIEMGLPRVGAADRADLIPTLLAASALFPGRRFGGTRFILCATSTRSHQPPFVPPCRRRALPNLLAGRVTTSSRDRLREQGELRAPA